MLIGITTFDKLPKLAREALANSNVLGTARANQGLHIKRAKAEVMAERIRRADAYLCVGDNMSPMVGRTRAHLNDILEGRA